MEEDKQYRVTLKPNSAKAEKAEKLDNLKKAREARAAKLAKKARKNQEAMVAKKSKPMPIPKKPKKITVPKQKSKMDVSKATNKVVKTLPVEKADVDAFETKPNLDTPIIDTNIKRTPAADVMPNERDGVPSHNSMLNKISNEYSKAGNEPAEATIEKVQDQIEDSQTYLDIYNHSSVSSFYYAPRAGKDGIVFFED